MIAIAPSKTPLSWLLYYAARFGARYSAELVLISAVLLAACGHLLIKFGLKTVSMPADALLLARVLAYLLEPHVIGGLAIYGVGTVLWVVAVANRPISYLYPVTAMNYVLITLGGTWLFGENVSAMRWLGISIVMFGVILMHSSVLRRDP